MKSGQAISFSYKGRQLKGIVVTVQSSNAVIKLDSGYNITIPESAMKSVKPVSVAPQKRVAISTERRSKQGLPKISLLHTGGTIASRVDYETGAVIAQFSADDILAMLPELQDIAVVRSRLVSNMQSELMRFAHWNLIGEAIIEEINAGADGVVVTHGTDILHMSAAALAFALPGIDRPVILVGSQRSSDRPSSDAASNLLAAVRFATESFSGIGVCMHEGVTDDTSVILPPFRCRKMHTSRRDAFRAINDEPYARITYPGLAVEQLTPYPKKGAGATFAGYNPKLKIGMLQAHPNMWAEEVSAYASFDGLVLSVLGIGHAPTIASDDLNAENTKVGKALATLAKKVPVVAAPQTIYGRVNMNVYSPGRQLLELGVLGQGQDLTPETAFVKLAWLLSNKQDVRKRYEQDLRGELQPNSRLTSISD